MLTCCWLLTLAPNWKRAPPPVMAKLVCPIPTALFSVRFKSSDEVLSCRLRPLPTVRAPLMVATAFPPTRALRRSAGGLVVWKTPLWAWMET